MGRNSAIEWTHHTFNPWWGCAKVSPACHNCYAERWSRRIGLELWGSRSPRRFFGDQHWHEPLRWERDAKREGSRKRVFCASMADVFEARDDLEATRQRLWRLIDETPSLDWLLLTKRPENVATGTVPWGTAWPPNAWLGATVESQEWTTRIPSLLAVPARVHFLSCEPLLGELDLREWLGTSPGRVGWVIAGGESGPRARPMTVTWVRDLRDQCIAANVPFHFKQWGGIRKGRAGRVLDGLTWDGLPTAG